jgi:hypothetical protein
MVAQSKSVIHLSTFISEDRKVVIDLPPDVPTGEVELELVIRPVVEDDEFPFNTERERIRAKMLAKGMLSTAHNPPDDMEFPTEDEIEQAGILPPGVRPSEDILREIRDEED